MKRLVEYNGVEIFGYNGSLVDVNKKDQIDAIVNAANTALCLGWSTKRLSEFFLGFSVGGIASAIGKRAGPQVKQECRDLIYRNDGWLKPGDAVCTSGGNLPVRYIIHAVSTRFLGSNEKIIRRSTKNSLSLAYRLDLEGVAFPLLGAGAGMIAPEKVARWMCEEIKENLNPEGALTRVAFAVPKKRNYDALKRVVEQVF